MSIIPFDPLNMTLGRLGRNPFENVFDPYYFSQIAPSSRVHTPMDVVEYEHGYELLADAPGIKPEEVTVTFDDDTRILTVRGDHSEVREHSTGDLVRQERTRRAFTRTFELPENAKSESITARINNGILNVYIPKKEEKKKAEPRRIDVKSHPGSVEVPTTHVHSAADQAKVESESKGKNKA